MATDATEEVDLEELYPSSDGKPLAETETHYLALTILAELLRDRYADRDDVYVGSNLMLYYRLRLAEFSLSPDIFLAFGVPREPPRRRYVTWHEGECPRVVFEFTSRSTRREDEGTKRRAYQDDLKAHEYFLFDPLEEYLDPPFQGYRLNEYVQYEPIPLVGGRMHSEVLGCDVMRVDGILRLWDTVTESLIPTRGERAEAEAEARQQAETLASDAETRAKQANDARVELQAQLEALKRQLAALQSPPPAPES